MDPIPNSFPILSYVMSKLPSIGPKHAAGSDFDIEQPPPPPGASVSKEPSFDLTERMPRLTDPKLIASMRSSVSDVSRARSVLKALGDRPDHETVDRAKESLAKVEENLSKKLAEIVLSQRPEDVDRSEWRAQLAEKEKECREAAESEREVWKAVISLDEMHEEYEKMLRDAELKLEKIYEMAESGGGVEEHGGSIEAEEEVNEEVVAVLREASGKEIDRIDLSGRQLRLLPEAFGRLHGLRVLNLKSNQLEAIPDSIGGLENLEELYIASNLLDSLPDCIGLLLKLKILDASSNRLVALPDSISRCRSLVELDVSFNKITYLPTNIGYELVNLKRLSIQLNKIRSLPSSVCEMTSLRILEAHFNELRGLPLAIGRLTNLETLNLGSNFADLKELPDTIGDLNNLKELDVSNNQIRALPDTFGRLDNLKKLNVVGNPLVMPPPEFVSRGVEAVKIFMAKRWLDILLEEDQKSAVEVKEETQSGWLTRSTSWLSSAVSAVSETVSGYVGTAKESPVDPYLNQQL